MQFFKSSFLTILAASALTASSLAAGSEFTVSLDSTGHLQATTTGGLVAFSYHDNKQECNDKFDACFIFEVQDPASAISGQQVPISASACDTSEGGTVVCSAGGVKGVMILSAGVGGTVSSVVGGAGQHAGQCSAIPVTVKRKAGVMSNIVVNDGCAETVVCTDKFNGDVEVDHGDKVVACSYYMRDGQPVGRP